MQDASSKQQTKQNRNPIISRKEYHLTQPCPSGEKQTKNKWTNKNSRQISSYTKLTQTTGSSLVSQFSHLVVSNSCDPMDCSMPGSSVLYYLPEFAQIHVHQVTDAIQPSISSSIVPFSSCSQSFPASGSFPKSQLFTSDGQSIGASVSASVFPVNIQDWFPSGLAGLISLQSKGLLKSLFQHHTLKTSVL